jgi:hypothetical protein
MATFRGEKSRKRKPWNVSALKYISVLCQSLIPKYPVTDQVSVETPSPLAGSASPFEKGR